MLCKARSVWHRFWFHYNRALIDGCLDENYRRKLIFEALYHEKQYLRYLHYQEGDLIS